MSRTSKSPAAKTSRETRLATFVHASDVHFGDLDRDTGSATLDAKAEDWWRSHRVFDGFLGHSYDALVHLADFFARLRDEENARLIVTGDLTTCGAPSQFDLARDYFEGHLEIDPGNPVGLQEKTARSLTIPGNHDHWPGKRVIWGQPSAGLQQHFPTLPIAVERISLGRHRELVFAGIDSDADVRPTFPGPCRLFARGKFVSQLRTLEATLGPPVASEVRVLLLHHSRSQRSYATGMVRGSRRALDTLVARRDVCVLLSGHVHVPRGERFTVSDRDGGAHEVMEARAGTTLQRDELPLDWVAAGSSKDDERDRLPPNTLLVHRLVEVDARIEWRTHCYRRSRTRGFVDEGPLDALAPLVVWPRPWATPA